MKIALRLWAASFWLVLAAVLWLALTRSPPTVSDNDKLQHVAAFAVLMGLGGLAYRRSWRLVAALFAIGVGIEVLQWTPLIGRDASLWDVVADAAGIGLALGVNEGLRTWGRRRSGRRPARKRPDPALALRESEVRSEARTPLQA